MIRTRLPSRWPLALLIGLAACASKAPDAVNQPIVEDKYRLSADRKAFEDLRAQVPEDKRRENDELAFILQWMGEVKRSPGEIREKFNSAVSKKRSEFQKDMEKRRETYVKDERLKRDAFQKELESERNAVKGRKMTSDERKSFFDGIETKRRDFYADSREKRDAFESEMRDQRKNFDDYVREKTSEFNQEHRAYTKRYDDYKKDLEKRNKEKEEAARAAKKNADSEFREMDGKPSRPLGTDE